MSTKIKNEKGEEIEMFTAEELQSKSDEAAEAAKAKVIEEYKAENLDKVDEIEKLQSDLEAARNDAEAATEELKKATGKEYNFSKLREAKEAAEKRADEANKKLENEVTGIKKLITDDAYNTTIEMLAGKDEDLKKKIEFHYKRLSDPADTKQAIEKKLRDAYILAAGGPPSGVGMEAFVSGAAPITNILKSNASTTIKPEVKEFGKAKFGLTDEDFVKYGGK